MAKRTLKRKRTQPQGVAYPELESALARMYDIQMNTLADRKRFLELELFVLNFCQEHGLDTYDHGPFKGTPVRPTGEDIDWDGLKKKLPPDKWKKILGAPQPEKAKLEALMELGEVDPAVVKEFITEKPIKPSVRITKRTDS
jgi:hypothetical protein